jgi:hypothetical protein
MSASNKGVVQAILRSLGSDGTCWLFVTESGEGWAITRNGKRVAFGTADRASIQAGVKKFAILTHPAAGGSPCDPVVQEHLDRIETQIRLGATVRAGATARRARQGN